MEISFELKTNVDEVIDYNNIVVEKVEEVTVPEKVEVVKTAYTIGRVKQELIDITNQISVLTEKKIELEQLKQIIEAKADEVLTAIK